MAYKRISPMPVIEGGTGIQSATSYAPLTGGTTSTGAFQSASTGQSTAGFVLTSTGSSSLPTFQAVSGSSSISSMFYANMNAENNAFGNTGYVFALGSITAGTVVTNTGSNGYVGNGAGTPANYTAPVTGYYQIIGIIGTTITATTGSTAVKMSFYVNGALVSTWWDGPTYNQCTGYSGFSPANSGGSGTIIIKLNSGDVVTWRVQGQAASGNIDAIYAGAIGAILLGI